MELRGSARDLSRILEGVRIIHYRHDNPLVACALETLVPHQLRTTASTRNGYTRCSSSIYRLSIHHSRPTSLYLFSILNLILTEVQILYFTYANYNLYFIVLQG